MNCTDLIVVGLVLVAGGVWLEAAGLPGARVPVLSLHVSLLGLGSVMAGMWLAGRLAVRRPDGGP